ncbi:MAG: TraB/GumN family protein [Chromatiales bacterium]|jgi:pheromone shutdown-related protein TraB|nr:TraB/GumN family protein [Chromatiales bacterium]
MNAEEITPEAPAIPAAALSEPMLTIEHEGRRFTLLGTAHVSRVSADKVAELLAAGSYDAIAIELCPGRHNAIVNPDALSRMNLFEVLRKKKTVLVIANLVLGAYQQRVAKQLGTQPGAEMRAAIDGSRAQQLPVLLIDREIGTTLKRVYRGIGLVKRAKLLGGLLESATSKEQVTAAEIERLKEGDMLESVFNQFAEEARELYVPLIDERDRYMSLRLAVETSNNDYHNILVVVGAGHVRGMGKYLPGYLSQQPASTRSLQAEISALDQVPPASKLPSMLSWLIVVLILVGFIIGFRYSPELGLRIVLDWILINGGLAALGSLIAGAHVLTILSAFVAAPLTALNPMIGVGMVTAAVEAWLRKPEIGDFTRLREDTSKLSGWWRNRVARILLIFIGSSLGCVLGTYIAGFLIFSRLAGN